MSLYYRGAGAILLCATKETLISVHEWTHIVREATHDAFIVLAITKCDSYDASEMDTISTAAEQLVSDLSLQEFVFTSAKLQSGVAEAFTACAKAACVSPQSTTLLLNQTQKRCC
jgi:GTPase SAR1 family protein